MRDLEAVERLLLGERFVGVLGMTASAESVVMKVEMLAMEVRNLFSLTELGRVKPSPSMISFAFASNELVVCQDSRTDRLSAVFFILEEVKHTRLETSIPGFTQLPLLAGDTIWQPLFAFLSIVEALGLRTIAARNPCDDFESISRSSGNTSNTELGRSFGCVGLWPNT